MAFAAAPPPEPGSTPDADDNDEQERLGPLVVRRSLKDDGRALIIYTRADAPLDQVERGA